MATSWYYAAGSRQVGPISETELDSLVTSGVVRGETLVWREGLASWTPHSVARPESSGSPSLPPEPSDVTDVHTRYCTECGRPTPARELAAFGQRLVCANCKPLFVQQLRERGLDSSQRQYAGFWIRFAAKIIDSILLYIVLLPITFLVLGTSAFQYNEANRTLPPNFWTLQGLLILFQIALTAGYEIWFLTHYAATPGKMVFGKKVIVADGSPMTFSRALARHLSTYISGFTLGIGYLMAAFDSEKRALHDRICDTRVVSK
jgi:uncharacterized RDD family membrane protein YckC